MATWTDSSGDGSGLGVEAQIFGVNQSPTGCVTINGTATQGQTLTASNTLTDPDGIVGAITYQWKRDGVDISNATGSTYVLTQADVGKAISVVANYVDQGGAHESVASAATSAVASPPSNPAKPEIPITSDAVASILETVLARDAAESEIAGALDELKSGAITMSSASSTRAARRPFPRSS